MSRKFSFRLNGPVIIGFLVVLFFSVLADNFFSGSNAVNTKCSRF